MNKIFVKNNANFFSNDLNDSEILIVIRHILSLKLDDSCKRTLIQQFLLNLIDVESISNK